VERAAKAEQIAELKEVFKTTNTVVVAHYAGLTVAQMQNLRKQARQTGTTVKVAKNRLAKIALEGTDVASISPLLKGPTVIAYSNDPVGASKVTADFAKANEKFVILGGATGQNRRPACGAGDQDRAACQRPRGEGGSCRSGLCQQEPSLIEAPNSTGSNRKRNSING
jgi:ribosomal protein L10